MRIAVFGLGIIGSVWSRHWVADGHQVRAWNRTAKPEHPGWCADAVAAVRDAELVAILVADGPAVNQVLDAVLPALPRGAIVVNHATIGVDETRAVAARVAAAAAGFLDMPFTGSKTASENRQVVYYVGGDAGLLARVEPAYRRLARALLPIGAVGDAMALKLAMNLMIAGTFQTLAEGFRVARAAGIDPATFFGALDLNVAKSGVADLKKPKLLAKDFSPQFSVKHLHKDLRHALALAAAAGVAVPQTALLREAYARAEAAGRGELDFSAMSEG